MLRNHSKLMSQEFETKYPPTPHTIKWLFTYNSLSCTTKVDSSLSRSCILKDEQDVKNLKDCSQKSNFQILILILPDLECQTCIEGALFLGQS